MSLFVMSNWPPKIIKPMDKVRFILMIFPFLIFGGGVIHYVTNGVYNSIGWQISALGLCLTYLTYWILGWLEDLRQFLNRS